MYAYSSNGIQVTAFGGLPKRARRLDTGEWVSAFQNASTELQIACGYYPVVGTAKPADTDTHTHDRVVTVESTQVVVTWNQREWTAEELEARADEAERVTAQAELVDKALTYLDQTITQTTDVSPTTQGNALTRIDLMIQKINALARIQRWIVKSQRIDQA